MARYIKSVSFVILAGLFAACASVHTPGSDGETRTYTALIEIVIQAAADSFVEAGLDIEEGAWSNDSTYVIMGHKKSRVLRAGNDGVQVAAYNVYIHRVSSAQTQVRMEQYKRSLPAAASSADRTDDYARMFFSILDGKLN